MTHTKRIYEDIVKNAVAPRRLETDEDTMARHFTEPLDQRRRCT